MEEMTIEAFLLWFHQNQDHDYLVREVLDWRLLELDRSKFEQWRLVAEGLEVQIVGGFTANPTLDE